jgi:peptidoglycan/LPS O-acetylase OafA/YrhL
MFRAIMILANLAVLGVTLMPKPAFDPQWEWLPYVIVWTLLGGNILCLWLTRREGKSRVRTIIGLWLDAKEHELRKRGPHPKEG